MKSGGGLWCPSVIGGVVVVFDGEVVRSGVRCDGPKMVPNMTESDVNPCLNFFFLIRFLICPDLNTCSLFSSTSLASSAVSGSPHCSHLQPSPSRSPPSPALEPPPLSSSVNPHTLLRQICRRQRLRSAVAGTKKFWEELKMKPCKETDTFGDDLHKVLHRCTEDLLIPSLMDKGV